MLPHVPALEKAGAVLVFGASLAAGIALLPSDTTKTVTHTEIVAAAPTPTSARPVTTEPPATGAATPVIGDACVGVNHAAPGQYSFLQFYFTTYPQAAGPWMFQVMQTPTGPLSGIGQSDKSGHGEVDVKIFAFGTYDGLSIRGPGNVVVPDGPFGSMFPFTVTSQPKACDAGSLKVPVAGSSTPATNETRPVQTTNPRTTTVTEIVHEDAGPPWSWLIPVGTASWLLGALWLDEKRRRECAEDDDDDDDDLPLLVRPDAWVDTGEHPVVKPDPFVDTGEHPAVNPEKYVDTDVQPPELPPVENLQDPPRKIDPDSIM